MTERLLAAAFPADVHPAGNWRCRCCWAHVMVRPRELVLAVPQGAVVFALCMECDSKPECRTAAKDAALRWDPDPVPSPVPS